LRRADNRLCDGPAAIYGSQPGTICGLALREIQAMPGQIGALFVPPPKWLKTIHFFGVSGNWPESLSFSLESLNRI